MFGISFRIRDKNRRRLKHKNLDFKKFAYRPIDVVVRLKLLFINHVFVVAQLIPVVLILHVHDLSALVLFILHYLHAFLIIVLSLSYLLSSLLLYHRLLLLSLHQNGVGLHIDRDNQGGESVATDNAAIVHDVLRSYLPIVGFKVNYLSSPVNLNQA
jgi:hypothetical protein